jgi:hypothetical protein
MFSFLVSYAKEEMPGRTATGAGFDEGVALLAQAVPQPKGKTLLQIGFRRADGWVEWTAGIPVVDGMVGCLAAKEAFVKAAEEGGRGHVVDMDLLAEAVRKRLDG